MNTSLVFTKLGKMQIVAIDIEEENGEEVTQFEQILERKLLKCCKVIFCS